MKPNFFSVIANLLSAWLIVSSLAAAPRINEFSATASDRLLVREPGQYPKVGTTRAWQDPAFDDGGWKSGAAPFGFGVHEGVAIVTDTAREMRGITPGLYLRIEFQANAVQAVSADALALHARYRDGFVAFLNGNEIARRNMGNPGMYAYHDQVAFNARTSAAEVTIGLGPASTRLVSGSNVLCIQFHSHTLSGITGNEFLAAARLTLGDSLELVPGNATWRYFPGHAEPSGGIPDYGLIGQSIVLTPDVPWAALAFNDFNWGVGVGPVGAESAVPPDYILGVNLYDEVIGITPSIYIRQTFHATAAEAISAQYLAGLIDYDDGMVVYLNGRELVRRNLGTAGVPVPHNAVANSNRNATGDNAGVVGDRTESLAFGPASNWLVSGDNILAVQLHRSNLTSSDSLAHVTLSTSGPGGRVLVSPTDPVRYLPGLTDPLLGTDEESDNDEQEADLPDSEADWIELHNPGPAAVDLTGWHLSDNANIPAKWTFPANTQLAAGAYLVVLASGLDLHPDADGTTYIHTNFSLSASGENLVLSDPGGTIISQVPGTYPRQSRFHSYGLDENGDWAFFRTSTPGEANPPAGLPTAAPGAPSFSIAGGFHPSPLSVSLSAAPGAVIHYTTNGGDPLDGGLEYSNPIAVSGNTVIRARALLPGALPSPSVTHTYLIGQNAARQSLAALCLTADRVTGLYGRNAAGGPSNGEGILSIKGGSYTDLVWSPGSDTSAFHTPRLRGRAFEKPASLELLPAAGDLRPVLRTDMGLRVAGSSHTRPRYRLNDAPGNIFTNDSRQKPSFNFYFREEFGGRPLEYPLVPASTISRYENIRLRAGKNDISNPFIKDELTRRIFRDAGQISSVGSFNTLWINGVFKGYFNLTERIREPFLREQFNSEATWDVRQVLEFASGDPIHWNQMIAFLRTTDFSQPSNYALVHDWLDVDNYIDYLLVNAYAAMWDWPHNNWIAARERSPEGRWRFLMWDAEGAFGAVGRTTAYNSFTTDFTITDALTTTNKFIAAIYTLLKVSPEFRLRFADRAQRQLFNGGALVQSRMTAHFEALRDEINPIMQDTIGASLNEAFHNNWIVSSTRRNNFFTQLTGQNIWPTTLAPIASQHGGLVPSGFQLTLTHANPGGTIRYTVNGQDPRSLGGAAAGAAYTGPISIAANTRVRARVLNGSSWSPEIDITLTPPVVEPRFLPVGSGTWTSDPSWDSSPQPYPNGVAARAEIPGAADADRNVNLIAPVTIGHLRFSQGATAFRNRVRNQDAGNTLTFDSNPNDPSIIVEGDGTGYVEFENTAGTILAGNLTLDVRNTTGNPEHGALRLRETWSGEGGLRKTGSGVASLTGEAKNFTGPIVIDRGVLQVTEPATPGASASVSVAAGGQLRLISGTPGGVRTYTFGGPLSLAGTGRGVEIPDGQGQAKLGALRYEPGSNDFSTAVVTNPISLTAATDIHVSGGKNVLQLASVSPGLHTMSKSGGGTLRLLSPANIGSQSLLDIHNGTLAFSGTLGSTVQLSSSATLAASGSIPAIAGSGKVVVNEGLLQVATLTADSASIHLGAPGAPDWTNPLESSNAAITLPGLPTSLNSMSFYLGSSQPSAGSVWAGGMLVPHTVDLAAAIAALNATVYLPDPDGTHEAGGSKWSPATAWTITTNSVATSLAPPFHQARMIELHFGQPKPFDFETWRTANFTTAQLSEPQISGPQASPFGGGISNLVRYALGVAPGDNPHTLMPKMSLAGDGTASFHLPFDARRDDLRILVESTSTLEDWTHAHILFDSGSDFPPPADANGWIAIQDTLAPDDKRFYRCRISTLPAP